MFLLENSRAFFVCNFSRFVVNYLKRIARSRAGRVGKGGSRTAHNRVRVVLGFSKDASFPIASIPETQRRRQSTCGAGDSRIRTATPIRVYLFGGFLDALMLQNLTPEVRYGLAEY